MSFTISLRVFGIRCIFFIVLPIPLKTCGSNVFFFLQEEMCAPEISGARQRFVCLSASDCHLAHNLFRPVSHHVRIFFERMTRLFKVSSLFFLQLQSSRTVMTFVVSGIVLLSVCNACKMS